MNLHLKTECTNRTYVLTWRDPKQKNRNVYVTIDKRYKWCPKCNEVVDHNASFQLEQDQ